MIVTKNLRPALERLAGQLDSGPMVARIEAQADEATNAVIQAVAETIAEDSPRRTTTGARMQRGKAIRLLIKRGAEAMLEDARQEAGRA